MMPYGLFGTPENLKENLPTFICSGFSAIYRENRGDGNDFLKLQILPLCFLPKDPQLESVRICRYDQDVTEIPVFQKPCCITEIKPCELAYLYPKYGDYCSRYLQEIARRNFIPSSLWAAIASFHPSPRCGLDPGKENEKRAPRPSGSQPCLTVAA